MPLPASKQAEPRHSGRPETPAYHFDMAHGDVAALHAKIERSFRETPLAMLPAATLPGRLDAAVQMLSRASGPGLLVASLAVIGHVLF